MGHKIKVSLCFKPRQPWMVTSGCEGDFHKRVYSWKDQWGRIKTGRSDWESGELSGEFMEWNSWKGHKDRNRHKHRIKRSGQAWFFYVFDTWSKRGWVVQKMLRACRDFVARTVAFTPPNLSFWSPLPGWHQSRLFHGIFGLFVWCKAVAGLTAYSVNCILICFFNLWCGHFLLSDEYQVPHFWMSLIAP